MKKQQPPMQFRWNMETGEVSRVGSPANENGPREQQGGLMVWADERDKLAAWKQEEHHRREQKGVEDARS